MTVQEPRNAIKGKRLPKDAKVFVSAKGEMLDLSTIILQQEQALVGEPELVSPIVILKGVEAKFEPETE